MFLFFQKRSVADSAPDPETASAVVAGAGDTGVNGTYIRDGSMNGRPKYLPEDEARAISWEGTYWQITDSSFSTLLYYSEDDVAYPWLAITWQAGDADEPVPTVSIG